MFLDSFRVDVDRNVVEFDFGSLRKLDRCRELRSVRSTDRVVVVRGTVESNFVLRIASGFSGKEEIGDQIRHKGEKSRMNKLTLPC